MPSEASWYWSLSLRQSVTVATPAIPSWDIAVCRVVTTVLSQTSLLLFFSYIILGKKFFFSFALLLSLNVELIWGSGVFS